MKTVPYQSLIADFGKFCSPALLSLQEATLYDRGSKIMCPHDADWTPKLTSRQTRQCAEETQFKLATVLNGLAIVDACGRAENRIWIILASFRACSNGPYLAIPYPSCNPYELDRPQVPPFLHLMHFRRYSSSVTQRHQLSSPAGKLS